MVYINNDHVLFVIDRILFRSISIVDNVCRDSESLWADHFFFAIDRNIFRT